MIDGALAIAAQRRQRHPQGIAAELVEMVMCGATRDRAAQAEGVTLAPEIGARHPRGRDYMMDPCAGREADPAARPPDAFEAFSLLAAHRIPADHAQLF